jgi:ABC-2 type transport system ATP-binding protein
MTEAAAQTPKQQTPGPAAGADSDVLIKVENLCKSYRDFQAVIDANFQLKRGEVVGFLGPNGAGKSTTMRMLVGALPPTRGKATVCGFDVFEDDLEVKRRVGYLPEIPPVYFDLTVMDQLKFGASLKGLKGAEAKQSIERSIERCMLHDYVHRLVGQLSKGYRQRVGLAQALLGQPDVLILDEPTVGLDPKQIQSVRELILELANEHTVMLSTHILQEVTMVCKRVIMIQHGRIIIDDPIDALQQKHGGKSIEEIFLAMMEETR